MTKEASLEPLNSKEVEQFLEGQRRARQDSQWKTSTDVKQTMAKVDKLQKKIAAAKKRKPTFAEAWAGRFTHQLMGRRITGLRYMTKSECEDFGWTNSCLVLVLSLGSMRDPDTDIFLIPQMDDEGNDAGVLNFTPIKPKNFDMEKFEELAPVLPSYDLEKTDHWMNEEKKKK